MILARGGGAALFAALALIAGPARADVLEIGDDGARWIAGEQADLPGPGATQLSAAWSEALPVSAMSDAGANSGAIPAAYAAKVHELARRFDLSPTLIEALVWQESRWQAAARSPVGARGLAQLMPATARYLGVDPDDPFANLEGGARYLREQLDRFDGDIEKALAAYNAGPGRVVRANGVPQIRETQTYVAAIMGRLANHTREDD